MNKSKGIDNLKYFFLSLFLFFVVFLCIFPKSTFAVSADCYVGSTKIGYMTAFGYSDAIGAYPWLTVRGVAGIYFYDTAQDVANINEVFSKIGSSQWQQPEYYGMDSYPFSWYVRVGNENENCGKCWVNVTWRSVRDGQMHYCNVLLKQYTDGDLIDNFTNTTCLSTETGCVRSSLPSSVKQAALLASYYGGGSFSRAVKWSEPDQTSCQQHRVFFRGVRGDTVWSANSCYGLFPSIDTQEITNGTVVAKISPSLAGHTIIDPYKASHKLLLFNFISDTTCGSGYSGGIPATSTPTPVSCPLAIQSMSFSGSGTPLINDYNTTQYKGSPQYTNFTANKNGKISKAEIYGTLDRDIPKGGKVLQCKITDSTGTTNLGESNTNNGAFTKGVSWMGVQFTTPVNIVNGTSYRLYCKVNNVYGGGSIYWLDNCWKRTDKAYRLYMCN